MALTTEGKRVYLETPAGKTDIGLPIQSVLDGMDFQGRARHGVRLERRRSLCLARS